MDNILIINRAWVDRFEKISNKFTLVEYTNETFHRTIMEVLSQRHGFFILVSDYHPELINILDNFHEFNNELLIRVEPEPFTHPSCHFSGLFFFSVLWLLKKPITISAHSYMIAFPRALLQNPKTIQILNEARTPGAFNIGILAIALNGLFHIKNIQVSPHRNSETLYETLKNEFIQSTASLIKLLEIGTPDSNERKAKPAILLKKDVKLKIPGHPFLTREFISGFRKYAPFWKEHLFEDHFALLSAIYSGKEETAIDDRTWIRIMLELLSASLNFENKSKIARRIFPIYALYLKSVHETSIEDRFTNYLEILEEETKFLRN